MTIIGPALMPLLTFKPRATVWLCCIPSLPAFTFVLIFICLLLFKTAVWARRKTPRHLHRCRRKSPLIREGGNGWPDGSSPRKKFCRRLRDFGRQFRLSQ